MAAMARCPYRRSVAVKSQPKDHPDTYLTLPQAAEIVGLSVKTLRRRISAGSLTAYRFGPRSIRIKRSDLEASGHRIPSARWDE
jgi:excisionase family DNA binding protein